MTPTEYENFKAWLKDDPVKLVAIKPNAQGTKYELTIVTPRVKTDGSTDQWKFDLKMEAQ